MSAYLLLLLLGALGGGIAIYLISKRRKKEKPYCIIGEDCTAVLGSKYNSILGIHNDVLGLLYNLGVIVLVLMLRYDINIVSPDLLFLALKLMTGGAAIMGVVFTVIQWRVLEKWCTWCIISNVNTWLIAFIVFGIL